MTHATYSPEDNKLRLYVGRVPRDDYERLRAAGYVSTPKQDCDFVATWTPRREDLAREFIPDGDDIGDEDYSPQERSADRAERFSDYRDKRADEAGTSADTFDAGPSAFGHQNRQRAERQAARHDRHRTFAVSQWSKAEYWQQRTAGVISHALHRSSARVRRGRILTLEAEQRRNEAARKKYAAAHAAWSKVQTLDGADVPIVHVSTSDFIGMDRTKTTPAGRFAYALANHYSYSEHAHPRNAERKASLYSLLTDPQDPITPREAAALWLGNAKTPGDPENSSERWARHYELRLTYERAMLAAEGGSAAEADMEPGGWINTGNRTGSVFTNVDTGWKQIQGVNKSPVTGRVTSVKVWGKTWSRIPDHDGKPCLVSVNIERLPEGAYRPPTEEERAVFQAETKARKAKEKATKPKEPPLVNPTDEDAARLQAHWNAVAKARFDKWRSEGNGWGDYKPTELRRMTQAEYSARSKGSYGNCETVAVCENGLRPRRWEGNVSATNPSIAFKVRKGYANTGNTASADAVIVITDKPQKPLPLDWSNVEGMKVGAA